MIKGINRQMIEVTHTGSPYFERAFFVVRATTAQPSDEHLERLAHKITQQADSYTGLKQQHRKRWIQRILWTIGSAMIGAGGFWLIQQIA